MKSAKAFNLLLMVMLLLGAAAQALGMQSHEQILEDLRHALGNNWTYNQVYNNKTQKLEHLFEASIRGTNLDIYKMHSLRIYLIPLPVLREAAPNGVKFEIFVGGERDGSLWTKNTQALRLVEMAMKRARLRLLEPLEPNQGNIQLGSIGVIQMKNSNDFKRIMAQIDLIIRDIEVRGHEAVLGKVK